MGTAVDIVWLKRDLRLTDHEPLYRAQLSGRRVILLYCFEPKLMQASDSDVRHWRFVWQSLQYINHTLHEAGKHLVSVYHADACEVFLYLTNQFQIHQVYAHMETGNAISFERDKSVRKILYEKGIRFVEYAQNGVQRGKVDRKKWNEAWTAFMEQGMIQNDINSLDVLSAEAPQKWSAKRLDAEIKNTHPSFQHGGADKAMAVLQSFLSERAANYAKHISKPLESASGCSRLSAYLAYGNLSMRQVYQATVQAMQHRHKRQLAFFIARLHWHCHFIQKFETECRMEFENLNRAFDAIRNDRNETYIQAWKTGHTGFPLVDASMRCLEQTGYINFRMRAMLVSFLTHNLWQHWNTGVHHLARYFLDYEPGIHYPQFQMQAGTMGVNTIRTYNPVKQSKDHDPHGVFIKKWIPELSCVPDEFIHEPWLMPANLQKTYRCRLGIDYPYPIVNLATTSRFASQQLWAIKKSAEARLQNMSILNKHTSRHSEEETAGPSRQKKVKQKHFTKDTNYKLF